jgi:hypothetical protein
MSNWSRWRDISSTQQSGDLSDRPGVYKIRLADSQGHQIPIERFLGKDSEGLLTIGESKHLRTRVKEFEGGWSKGRFGRSTTGDRLFLALVFKQSYWKSRYRNPLLQVSVMKVSSKKQAQKQEENCLKNTSETSESCLHLKTIYQTQDAGHRSLGANHSDVSLCEAAGCHKGILGARGKIGGS